MLKRYYQVFGSVLIVTDAIGLVAAWLLAYYLRFYTQIVPVTKGIPPFSRYVALTVPVVLLWIAIFSSNRLYRTSKIMRRTTELGQVLRAHLLATGAFVVLTWVITEYRFSRVVIVYFMSISGVYLLFTRLFLRNFLRRLVRHGFKSRPVVIVGTGASALAAVDRMRRMPEPGIQVKGFFSLDGRTPAGLPAPVLGSYSQIAAVCAQLGHGSEIIIALPRAEASEQDAILRSLGDTTHDVYLVPDLYEYIVVGCTVEDFDQVPVLALNESPIDPIGAFMKRCFDFACSFFALLVLSPLLALIAIAVKLTSRGPVFYGQVRMGLDGSTFKMWKFRSMRMDAEKDTGAVWAKKGDDRRTPIGAFLRSTSLDELPQFWNVLVGDMSLVGPRPERPEFVHQFRGKIPAYMLRHKVKAGITGWAQVNGWRGDTSLEKRIECDLYYIRNWNFLFDVKILLLTPLRGFVNKNAY
ncbi:MAG: undecaprenyl-phosphate glucose phosphotransferase [Bdellovibrionota bacterium]